METVCQCCESNNIKVIYDDYIRYGSYGNLTKDKYKMYQCQECGLIWHKNDQFDNRYYETTQYRSEADGISSVGEYYPVADSLNSDKFEITEMDIFRNKVVADIGCAVGSFLDLLHGIAKETIGIEPSEMFRDNMQKKGHKTFPYAGDAVRNMGGVFRYCNIL